MITGNSKVVICVTDESRQNSQSEISTGKTFSLSKFKFALNIESHKGNHGLLIYSFSLLLSLFT